MFHILDQEVSQVFTFISLTDWIGHLILCDSKYLRIRSQFVTQQMAIKATVSSSGQNLKTRVSGSWEKKPGKTRVFSGFEMNATLSDKNSISLRNYCCWSLRNLLANH